MTADQTRKLDAGKAPLWLVPWEILGPMIPEPARRAAFDLHQWVWRRAPAPKSLGREWTFGAADVLAFGAKKYSPGGWERGIEFTRVASAGLRHALEYGTNDPESGLPHEYHLACNLIFAATFEARGERYAQFDDRPPVIIPAPAPTFQGKDNGHSIHCECREC
jgi:hypothetical protein